MGETTRPGQDDVSAGAAAPEDVGPGEQEPAAARDTDAADGPDTDTAHGGGLRFDRHLVLEQLGGWRGMVDTTLPTVAFIVGNAVRGLSTGIWSSVVAAVLIFVLRLVRRESVQQAISGLFGVVIAVVIAAMSGHARDYFVLGIVRNAAIGVVLLGSALVRRPLVGYLAEFLAPSHLGSMATHSLPLWRSRAAQRTAEAPVGGIPVDGAPVPGAPAGRARGGDPAPERHWRDDRRMLRAYTWLTVLWAVTFLARVVVQGPLYQANDVGLLGTTSLLLGLPVTAVALLVSLWVVARLHRHRCPEPAPPEA